MVKRLTADQIDKIKNLAKAGISIAKIAKMLNIGKTTVYYHALNYCRKMTKLNLNLITESEKGYILGFFLGDGDINKWREKGRLRYIVRFSLDKKRDQDISEHLCRIFQKGRKKVSVFPRGATMILKVSSKELISFIQEYIEYEKEEDGRFKKKLKPCKCYSSDFQYGILAGLIDSDGHVAKHLGTEIKTVSTSLSTGILDLLTNLGMRANFKEIGAKENSFSKKTRYYIYIPSAEMKAHKNRICSVKIQRYK